VSNKVYFANITRQDNALIDDTFHLGALSIGAESFHYIFLLKNELSTPIYDTRIYIHSADNYQGNNSDAEDLAEILNVWPSLTNKYNKPCGLYILKNPYAANVDLNNSNNWVQAGSDLTFTNPWLVPILCIPNGTQEGYIPCNSYAQIVMKLIVPNVDAMASVKCCSLKAVYKSSEEAN